MRSWDDLYADREFHWEGAESAVIEIAAEWRERGITLIHDLGCGAGRNMGFLQGEGFTVIGSDVSPRGLAACAVQLGRASLPRTLVQADMTSLPFRDGAFDAVRCGRGRRDVVRADPFDRVAASCETVLGRSPAAVDPPPVVLGPPAPPLTPTPMPGPEPDAAPQTAALESELQRRFASGAKRKEAARTIHAEYGRLLEEELAEAELAQGEVEHLSLESHLHQSWAAP